MLTILQAVGIGMNGANANDMLSSSLPMSLAFLAIGVYGLYIFVQLGALRGTTSTNSFGPDPLDGTA
ncbi:MAG: hypothetical protein MO846_04935 [Candidatus Devosia symbiotica]|nr:hypothetical protein [Candidatus Devosia symbiotica]